MVKNITKNIISFSLYGNKINYWKGAIENIKVAQILYPNFICRFYVDQDADKNLIKMLDNDSNKIEIIFQKNFGGIHGMFWRFLGSIDPEVDIFLSRDVDSLPDEREVSAVNDWLKSNKDFHIMRDNNAHTRKILGGLWGCRNHLMIDIGFEKLLSNCHQRDNYGDDEIFLENTVYPKIKRFALEHTHKYYNNNDDKFLNLLTDDVRPFPLKNNDLTNFLGKQRIFE